MNENEPVAYMDYKGYLLDSEDVETYQKEGLVCIPLYTRPAKAPTTELQALLDSVNGDCYLGKEKEEALVAQVRKQYSEPAKTLTDEEIENIAYKVFEMGDGKEALFDFARAILKKASEK